MFKKLLTAAAFAGVLLCGAAELTFNGIFDTNMVLQRQVPLRFFGTADPNAAVKVAFAGKTVSAAADAKGNWQADFPAMEAGGPFRLSAESNGKKVELDNVMTGEVWFCSGQSNMEMPVGKKFVRGWSAQNCEEELKNADWPDIRFCKQKRYHSRDKISDQPVYDIKWSVCSPETLPPFSATAYFFGRELHKKLNVPIGLIECAWSGSNIEPWISPEGYRRAGLTKELDLLKEYDKTPEELQQLEKKIEQDYIDKIDLWHADFLAVSANARAGAANYAKFDFDDSAWPLQSPKAERGSCIIRWYRTSFESNEERAAFTVSYRPVVEMCEIYVNGEKIAGFDFNTPRAQQRINGVRIDPKLVKKGKNVIAVRFGRIYDKRAEDWATPYFRLFSGKNPVRLAPWKCMDEISVKTNTFRKNPIPRLWQAVWLTPGFPACKYNTMVVPWVRYPIRGVIWYQGCSNAGDPHYYPLMKALIADWRRLWNDPSMPFALVQLAGFGGKLGIGDNVPPEFNPRYPLTREIQEEMLEIPNVGVACAVDIGENDNIHPANKQDVGRRLAAEAMRTAYGSKEVSHGPRFDSMKVEGDKVRVFFRKDGFGSGLTTKDGKKPGSFSLAGADGRLVWADAAIDGDTVVVSSPKVKEPKIVRYAYEPTRGDANLCNKEGFPAYPFRSDKLDYSQVK